MNKKDIKKTFEDLESSLINLLPEYKKQITNVTNGLYDIYFELLIKDTFNKIKRLPAEKDVDLENVFSMSKRAIKFAKKKDLDKLQTLLIFTETVLGDVPSSIQFVRKEIRSLAKKIGKKMPE
jgi:hypothetical protein